MKAQVQDLQEESFVEKKEIKGLTNHELHELVHEHCTSNLT